MLNNLLSIIERTLFRPQSPKNIALLRITLPLVILIFSLPPIRWLLNLALVNETFINPPLIIELFSTLLGNEILLKASTIKLLYLITIISGTLSILGFFSKYSIPIMAFCYTFIVAYMWSFGEIHHPRTILCWFLIILAIAGKSSDVLSLDAKFGITKINKNFEVYGWPNTVIMISLASAYCFSGLWKLFYQGGIEWLNGYTLQYYIVSKEENIFTDFLIDKRLILIILSIFSVFLEILFPLAIFLKNHAKWFLIAAFFFHLGNFILRGENGIFILWPITAIGFAFPIEHLTNIKKLTFEFKKK